MNRHLVPFYALLSACTPLPDVARSECGNKVVEAGELCDTFTSLDGNTRCGGPEHEHACAFVCDVGAECPKGWGCGDDGRCRRPVTRFVSEGDTYEFRGTSIAAGDLDGDGDIDIVGTDRDRLSVTYVGPDGRFGAAETVESRQPTGPSSFVDFDADGRLDVLVPSVTGLLVWLGRSDQKLVPRAYDAPIGAEINGALRAVVLRDRDQIYGDGDLLLISENFAVVLSDDAPNAIATLPSGVTAETLPAKLPMAELDVPADGRLEVAFAAEGSRRADVYRVVDATFGHRLEVQKTLMLPGPLVGSLHFADLNADSWQDVVASTRAGIAIAYGDPTQPGGFHDACVVPLPGIALGLGLGARLLAAVDLTGDGFADLVFDRGIAVNVDGRAPACDVQGPHELTQPTIAGTWAEAEIGDYNGDGRTDVAVSVPDDARIDVLYGTGSLLLNRRSLLLSAPADHLVAGDFDGDFNDDITFVSARDSVLGDEMSVAFGEVSAALTDPIVIGRFGSIADVNPGQLLAASETFDALTDLFVLSQAVGESGVWSAATLYGSATRRLFAPLSFEAQLENAAVSGAVAGDFCKTGDSEGLLDIAVVYANPTAANVWFGAQIPSEPPGGISAEGRRYAQISANDREDFDFGCATFAAGDWDGDGQDEIFGLDHLDTACGRRLLRDEATLMAFDFSGEPCTTGIGRLEVDSLAGARGAVRLDFVDVDRDGDPDLFAVFRGRNGNGDGVWVFFNEGAAISARSAVRVAAPRGLVSDATFAQLDEDPALELVMRVRDSSTAAGFAYAFDLEGRAFMPPQPLDFELANEAGSVVAADFDGDGLDDLAFAGGGLLEVFRALDGAKR